MEVTHDFEAELLLILFGALLQLLQHKKEIKFYFWKLDFKSHDNSDLILLLKIFLLLHVLVFQAAIVNKW